MILAGRVLAKMYDMLPLDGVVTDYEGRILRRGDSVWVRYQPALVGRNSFVLTCDKQVVVPVDTEMRIAFNAARFIVNRHSGKWFAFAAQVSIDGNLATVVYGVKTTRKDGGK